MDRNEKIAFGILGFTIVTLYVHDRALTKIIKMIDKHTEALNVVAEYLDQDFQEEIDEKFTDIVEHYDE